MELFVLQATSGSSCKPPLPPTALCCRRSPAAGEHLIQKCILQKMKNIPQEKSIFVYHVFAAGGIRAKPQHHAAGRSSGGNRQPTPGHVQPVCSCILSTGWSSLLVSLRPSSRPLNSPFTPLYREFCCICTWVHLGFFV